MERTAKVIARGQKDGSLRSDLPAEWLVSAYYALIHSADDRARTHGIKRDEVLTMLKTTLRDLVRSR